MSKKLIATLILLTFLATTLGVGLAWPRPAQAFLDSGTIFWPLKLGIDITNKIAVWVDKALGKAGAIAYKNALGYFLNKIAQDTAVWLATGDKGSKPLFITESWGKYLEKVGDEALGGFMYDLFSVNQTGYCERTKTKKCRRDSDCPTYEYAMMGPEGTDESVTFGHTKNETCILPPTAINVCEPTGLYAKLEIHRAVFRSKQVTAPKCSWQEMKNKWKSQYNDPNFLRNFSVAFVPEETDLGVYVKLRSSLDAITETRKKEAEAERIANQGFKAVTSKITGYIKTPATMLEELAKEPIKKSTAKETTYTGQVWADALGTFTNTLANKLLDKWLKKGMWSLADLANKGGGGGGFSGVGDFFLTKSPQQAALEFFAELGQPQYSFDLGVKLTSELSIQGEDQFNNVIDDKFSRAVEEKCTIGQAIGYYKPGDDAYRADCAGLISGTAYFGYNEDGTEPSVMTGIPYRSILVLRKFRIVPVGWELAAEYFKNFELPNAGKKIGDDIIKMPNLRLNLNRLVFLYDKKYLDDKETQLNPYYGLVDPDWLLKAPATRCVRQGAGPAKIEQEPYCLVTVEKGQKCPDDQLVYPFQRYDYCADYQTCLAEKSNGSCDINNWGYCLAEKPIWQIDGEECTKKYYTTCQTLTNSETNKTESYLLNTVSGQTDGVCDQNNSGCREYCTDLAAPFGLNDWTCRSTTTEPVIFLTAKSEACSAKAEGCSLFFSSYTKDQQEVLEAQTNGASDPNAYGLLKKNYTKLAPDYYQCQGYTQLVSGVGDKITCENANHFWRSDLNVCVESGTIQCTNFTKHCGVNDVNCKLYTPTSTHDPAVPAVIKTRICPDGDNEDCHDETDPAITWNDQCPASCVGYKNYHQEKTSFESDEEVNFIAKTGRTCSEPGCDEFTNLDEVARGGEGIEYYSYLRQCIKPEQGGWQTYYTWEGSDTTGYQLKKWELLEDDALQIGETSLGPEGTQCDDLTKADCREFFDQNLNPHKRFYSTTIVVSDDCHPFRRTTAETDGGAWCAEHQGEMNGDKCIYQAIPSESKRCSTTNNLCREYKSNAGYNYQKIIESYFTSSNDLGGWTGGEVSNESVRRGDYSLKVNGSVEHELVAGDLEEGKIYTLEFLGKGSGPISAKFTGSSNVADFVDSTSSDLTDDWRHHILKLPAPTLPSQVSPGLTKEQTANTKIEVNGTGTFYLDNIILKKGQNLLLIKNSWTTPNECETDPPLTGGTALSSMLGCEAYKDNENKNINLRNFDHLCFEDVVGCELVIDSQNSAEMGGSNPDTLDYLVLDKKFSCGEKEKGCTRLGLITPVRELDEKGDLVYQFTDKYKIVDPDQANWQTCEASEIFCQTYTDEKGNPYFFRESLDRACEYRQKDGDWFKVGSSEPCGDGTDTDSDNDADEYPGECENDRTLVCSDDNDCTGVGGSCINKSYQKHCLGGRAKNPENTCDDNSDCTNLANPEDDGLCVDWTGNCESASSGCREYQDPQEPAGCDKKLRNHEGYCQNGDVTGDELCTSNSECVLTLGEGAECVQNYCNYYYFKDVSDESACDQGVNPSQGCVGFNQTDNSALDIRSYKVCEEDTRIACSEDSDCASVGGRCKYMNIDKVP